MAKAKQGTKKKKAPAKKKGKLPLPEEELVRMYKSMVMTRALDERGMNLQRQGRIGFFVPVKGQEGAHVGAAHALEEQDWVVPSYRSTGMAIHRGAPLVDLVAQLWGNSKDISRGRQMPNHFAFTEPRYVSISSPIGTQISQAVGIGMAAKIRKDPVVSLVCFGDGATSSNDFHAGLNFAGVFKAPVVFFCENNGWAISVPLSKQTACTNLAEKAKAYGFEGVRVDGNDAMAVHEAVKKAAEKARKGGGPTMIEAITYRMGPHSSSDDASRYREAKEVEEWGKKDPIVRFRKKLEQWEIWNKKKEEQAWEEARGELSAVIKEVEKADPLKVPTMFDDVYAEIPPFLQTEKEELLEELAGRKEEMKGEGAFPL